MDYHQLVLDHQDFVLQSRAVLARGARHAHRRLRFLASPPRLRR
jgi:hypothetical protein